MTPLSLSRASRHLQQLRHARRIHRQRLPRVLYVLARQPRDLVEPVDQGGDRGRSAAVSAARGLDDRQEEWVGARPMTPDGLPLTGPLPGSSRVMPATGHNMLGLILGPATGRMVTGLLTGGERTPRSLRPSPPAAEPADAAAVRTRSGAERRCTVFVLPRWHHRAGSGRRVN
ncbi:FAD-dependent oxidoreductase [Streptomyces sp. NPDC004647]|uniref:FAD-dependent oxidoreductase n=1 Tax=Streptomyces sp. NPDC004647 TaxID=3154671 RepID=UPI0033BAA963